jgi:hypothetical protein
MVCPFDPDDRAAFDPDIALARSMIAVPVEFANFAFSSMRT